jgi:hypothetical protein
MKTPEQMRRDNAQGQTPQRDGGGQMGRQKSGGGDSPDEERERGHVNPGRDRKPGMDEDDGGRVPNK